MEQTGWDVSDGSSPLEMDNFVEAAQQAEANGLEVLIAGPDELFLDLDNGMERFEYRLQRFVPIFSPGEITRWHSRSGGDHWHVRIKLNRDLSVGERSAIQSSLGSDPLKELLTVAREILCSADPEIAGKTIRLFKPKDNKVEYWTYGRNWQSTDPMDFGGLL